MPDIYDMSDEELEQAFRAAKEELSAAGETTSQENFEDDNQEQNLQTTDFDDNSEDEDEGTGTTSDESNDEEEQGTEETETTKKEQDTEVETTEGVPEKDKVCAGAVTQV